MHLLAAILAWGLIPARGLALFNGAGQDIYPLPAVLQSSATVTYSNAANASLTISSGLVVSTGTVGVGGASRQARLDATGFGNSPHNMAQIWRDGNGTVVSSMSVTGVMRAAYLEGNGGRLAGLSLPNDDLGTHLASQDLSLSGFELVSVSTIELAGAAVIGGTGVSEAGYAVSIGPSAAAYSNYDYGLGINAYNNYAQGVGIGYGANNNYNRGVGVGFNAVGNYSGGVGLGRASANNILGGVGIGYNTANNDDGAVGLGPFANNNNPGAVGIGRYASQNAQLAVAVGASEGPTYNSAYSVSIGPSSAGNRPYAVAAGVSSFAASSAVAAGYLSSSTVNDSLAFGANTVNNSAGTASFGSYALYTSSGLTAVKFIGDGGGLTNLPSDNLGNHTANMALTMGAYGIAGASQATVSSYTASGIGVSAAAARLAPLVALSSSSASQQGGVYASTNVYMAGLVTLATAKIAAPSINLTVQPPVNSALVVASTLAAAGSITVSTGSVVSLSGPAGTTYLSYDGANGQLLLYVEGGVVARIKR